MAISNEQRRIDIGVRVMVTLAAAGLALWAFAGVMETAGLTSVAMVFMVGAGAMVFLFFATAIAILLAIVWSGSDGD